MKRHALVAVVVLALVVAGALGGRSLTNVEAQEGTAVATADHPLVGSWIVVDQRDLNDGPSVTSFTGDGVVVDASAAGRSGAGSWEPTGPRSGAATFVYVVENETGIFAASVVIRATFQVDDAGDSFTAPYSYTAVAADGTILNALESTAHGVRVPVEPVEAVGTPLAGFPTVATPAATPEG